MGLNNIKQNAKLLVKDWLESIFAEMEISENENLIEKGLSSIQVMQLSGKLKKTGIRISFAKLMEDPSLSKWFDFIDQSNIKISKDTENLIGKSDNKQFTLTDVQYSYLIGREDNQILGGVGCHAYLEIDGENIKTDRLNNAWNKLQYRHPMLRAKFTNDGYQEILSKPYSEEIEVFDLSDLDEETIHSKLIEIRENISHRKLNVNDGQVAGLSIAKLADEKSRIFFDIDLLVSDVMSMSIVIKELAELYSGIELGNLDAYTFKDYIQNATSNLNNKEDKEFWEKKINSFEIERPNLPLKKQPEQIKETKFTRRKRIIKKDKWETIKEIVASYKSTPSMVLLAAYALVLERWCNQEKFFINIPLFSRDLENEYLKDMVADFTNILLVEHESVEDLRFLDTLRRINKTFLENVSHSAYSGVQVQRDISKNQGTSVNIAPVVFACNIDYPLETEISRKNLGEVSYMISQTPGVWLDFQSYVIDGDLIICWDAVEKLFPEKLLDDMFLSFCDLLNYMSDSDDWNIAYDVLPKNQKLTRKSELESILPLSYPEEKLYDRFINNVKINPNDIAIIDADSRFKITYKELYYKSLEIASMLLDIGVKKGEYVAITLPRGYKQVYAIFGILFAGAVYVPVGINQPNERRIKIYDQIKIKYVVTDNCTCNDLNLNNDKITVIDIDKTYWDENKKMEYPIKIDSNFCAYVIMTSGTTGTPKGVEICHASAVNTIIDLNDKYKVDKKDNLIMVSSIDFDLSVYDIFGVLSAGGTLITLNEENYKDPDLWIDLIDKCKVTLWNSVPILFDMLVTMAEGKNYELPLRTVMLSGDWIGINLVERFYKLNKDSLIVGMGGATEASIWSNYINIPQIISDEWISIPYGKALKNQVYRVIDDFGRICPNYVKGELIIGGVGVANCYRGDKELTDRKFFIQDGTRWYITGDNGRTWNDGIIEFLGRKDKQVKIKGHRIELGEIEEAIRKFPNVDNAVVDYIGNGYSDKRLISFVKIKDFSSSNIPAEIEKELINLEKNLKRRLNINRVSLNYDEFIKNINILCLEFIIGCFKDIGIDFSTAVYSNRDIQSIPFISTEGKKMISRWIDILERFKIIELEGEAYRYIKQDYLFADVKNEKIKKIKSYFFKLIPDIKYILMGEKRASEVLYSRDFKFYDILKYFVGYDNLKENILQAIEQLAEYFKDKKIRILEIGTRDIGITSEIIKILDGKVSKYVYMDDSEFYRSDLRELLERDFFEYEVVKGELSKKFSDNSFDIVIAINSLHRSNITDLEFDISKVLMPFGLFLGVEVSNISLVYDAIIGVIEAVENKRDSEIEKEVIVSVEQVSDSLKSCNYYILYSTEYNDMKFNGNILVVASNYNKIMIENNQLKQHLEDLIPTYMIPDIYYNVEKFPLSKNGKIDRAKLKELAINYSENKKESYKQNEDEGEYDDIEKCLCEIWKTVLSVNCVSKSDNYFNIGGDSLTATEIAGKISNLYGVKISIKDIFENPTMKELAEIVNYKRNISNCSEQIEVPFVIDLKNKHKPFPLTDVQFAYWIGKNGGHNLSNISTSCYFEIELSNININKLEKTFNQLIEKHDMMKAIILNEEQQQILENVPWYTIKITDLSGFGDAEILNEITGIRSEIYNRTINYDKWPLFDVRVTKIKKDIIRLHVRFENIIFDGWSMFHVLRQWQTLYDEKSIPSIDISYRDYVLALEKLKNTKKYVVDKEYWEHRIENFPEYPKLPLMNSEDKIKNVKFTRKEFYLSKNKWNILKETCKKYGVTAGAVIITAYSEILKRWSPNKHFALNVTRFDREQLHNSINEVIGDFTSLNLLEIKERDNTDLYSKIINVQNQLLEDISHSLYSPIEFERKLRKKSGNYMKSVMPIVFTSGIGIDDEREDKWVDNLSYSISQTPQVWLDHQVFVIKGGLYLSWDYVEELFEEDIIIKMFDEYKNIINLMINNDNWDDVYVDSLYAEKTKSGWKSFNEEFRTEQCENIEIIEKNGWNDIEFELINLFKEVLSAERINNSSNFFIEGGDSLKAVRLVRMLNEKFNIHISIKSVFEYSTPSKLAEFIFAVKK